MLQFYNYYLLKQFIRDASQDIDLQLRVDILSGITGLVIILTGLIYAYICQIYNENDKNEENIGYSEKSSENITDIVKK
jgi:hypothetical protein